MDIFAHGLWTGVSYEALKRNSRRRISVSLAVFWGLIPDFFAFTIPFVYMFWNLATRGMTLGDFKSHVDIEPIAHTFPFYDLSNALYNISHSIFVFAAIFILVAVIRKRAVWEMGAWLLHIIIDIPTHSYNFFPTPFLWPVSDFRVNGFSWGTPSFMFINYSLIFLSITILFFSRHRKNTGNVKSD